MHFPTIHFIEIIKPNAFNARNTKPKRLFPGCHYRKRCIFGTNNSSNLEFIMIHLPPRPAIAEALEIVEVGKVLIRLVAAWRTRLHIAIALRGLPARLP